MKPVLHWVEDHVPAWLLVLLPGVGIVLGAFLDPDSPWVRWFGVALALLVSGSIALVFVRSGLVTSWRDLPALSLAGLAKDRNLLQQRAAVLQTVVEQLRTSSRRAENAASQLLSELVRAEEATRANIAADLHDTVAQCLSAALQGLRGVTTAEQLEARESVRDAELELRTVLARIRPPELTAGDLATVVGDLCTDLHHRYDLRVAVRWDAVGLQLPVAFATVVYRFLQESLLNAVEHADGVGVTMTLEVVDAEAGRGLVAEVTDEGPGFSERDVVSAGGRHVGLKLAQERARLAGGTVTIRSAPGAGTSVRLFLPLEAIPLLAPPEPALDGSLSRLA